MRIPKGVTITVGMEDARRLIETNKAVFAHAATEESEADAPAVTSPAEAVAENNEEETMAAAQPASDKLADEAAPAEEISDLSELQPPQAELQDSEREEVDDDAPELQK